ncbi:hypothetical protein BT69DRAFT_1393845 [Atractiella rhizophila]|nr:hypothetical protein BT69DRAFT_1393845 [Atractiella rhizophila]
MDCQEEFSSDGESSRAMIWKQENELLERYKSLPPAASPRLGGTPSSSSSTHSTRKRPSTKEPSSSNDRPYKRVRSLNSVSLLDVDQEDEWSRMRQSNREGGDCFRLLGELMMKQNKEKGKAKVKGEGRMRRTTSETEFGFQGLRNSNVEERMEPQGKRVVDVLQEASQVSEGSKTQECLHRETSLTFEQPIKTKPKPSNDGIPRLKAKATAPTKRTFDVSLDSLPKQKSPNTNMNKRLHKGSKPPNSKKVQAPPTRQPSAPNAQVVADLVQSNHQTVSPVQRRPTASMVQVTPKPVVSNDSNSTKKQPNPLDEFLDLLDADILDDDFL